MIKYPSIEQFRNVVKAVQVNHDYQGKDENGKAIYEHKSPYPKITFTGTVKLHGTNASVVRYKEGTKYQSRERELSLASDNYNFMLDMSGKNLEFLFADIPFNESIAVFGEWVGSGIQSGVAISQLKEKLFVIFGVVVDGKWDKQMENWRWDNSQGIYGVTQFGQYSVEIDFNEPGMVQNYLVELADQVEKQCPAGRFFGINGVGEGIVWKAEYNGDFYQFKVKGEKHTVTKVRTLSTIDPELIQSAKAFAERTATEARFEQGFQAVGDLLRLESKDIDKNGTGLFLKWVMTDILKEESDALVASHLEFKKVAPEITKRAKIWFFNKLDQLTPVSSENSKTQTETSSSEPVDTPISSFSQLVETAEQLNSTEATSNS